MNKHLKSVACIITASIIATSAQASQVMRCSHQLPPENHIAKIIDQWAAEIETLSENEIDVQVFNANSLVKAPDNAAAVTAGDIECAFSISSQWATSLPLMSVTLEPFAMSDIETLKKWGGSRTADELNSKLLSTGVKNIAWLFTTGRTVITSKARNLIKPADFLNVKIQGLEPSTDAAFMAMGAMTIPMPDKLAYQALAKGEIDAGVTDVSAAVSEKYYEVQDHATILPLFSVLFNGYVNPSWYDRLSEKSRQAIQNAGRKASVWAIEASEISAAAAPGKLAEEGMKIHFATESEITALREVMVPAFVKAFSQSTGNEGIKLIQLLGESE